MVGGMDCCWLVVVRLWSCYIFPVTPFTGFSCYYDDWDESSNPPWDHLPPCIFPDDYAGWLNPLPPQRRISEAIWGTERGGAVSSLWTASVRESEYSPSVSRGFQPQKVVDRASQGTGRQLWLQLEVLDPTRLCVCVETKSTNLVLRMYQEEPVCYTP